MYTYYGNKSIFILDTGFGNGAFGVRAYNELNISELIVCDPSKNMLSEARTKLKDKEILFRNISSQQLDYTEQFDLVTAIQSHHYVDCDLHATAVMNCYKALKKGGMFICFENTAPYTQTGKNISLNRVEKYGLSAGRIQEEVLSHSARYNKEYFSITPSEHVGRLRNTGFSVVEML